MSSAQALLGTTLVGPGSDSVGVRAPLDALRDVVWAPRLPPLSGLPGLACDARIVSCVYTPLGVCV